MDAGQGSAVRQDKVVIEVGLNEGTMRSENPRVPYSPEEIAQTARDCYNAGAAVIHFHARDPQSGVQRLTDIDLNAPAMRLIGETTPLIAYPTYADIVKVLDYYFINGPAKERFKHFAALVGMSGVNMEIGPVDLGSMGNNARWEPQSQQFVPSAGLNINTGLDHQWLLDYCRAHGLKVSFATFEPGHIRNLRNIVNWRWTQERPILVKFFFGGWREPFGMRPSARALLYCLEEAADLAVEWMPVVYGGDQFAMTALALEMGGHARVGIGDYPYSELGSPSNASLVERVVALARALGREPATPEEAREIWGINAAKRSNKQMGIRGEA